MTHPKTSADGIDATEAWADSDAGVKDALMESAAEEQRAKGLLPTARENEGVITEILGTFDRKGGAKQDATPATEKQPSAWEREFQRRGGGRSGPLSEWTTVKGEPETIPFDRPVIQKGNAVRDEAGRRIDARLALLKRTPGWMDRVKYVMRRYHGDERKRRLSKIIQESNKHFGHWAKDPAKPLWFS